MLIWLLGGLQYLDTEKFLCNPVAFIGNFCPCPTAKFFWFIYLFIYFSVGLLSILFKKLWDGNFFRSFSPSLKLFNLQR